MSGTNFETEGKLFERRRVNMVDDKVIVADAELHTSLSIIRALSKHKIKVFAVGRGKTGGYLSNKVWKKIDLSDLSDNEYYNYIIKIATLEKVKAVFAHYEKTLLRLYEILQGKNIEFKLIMPPYDLLKFVSDKTNVLHLVKELGIPLPDTTFYDYNEQNDLKDLIEVIKYNIPCIIKVSSEINNPLPGPKNRYVVIKSQYDLKEVPDFVKKHKNLIIQRYIEGYGCGIAGIFHMGDPLAIGGHIRLRESFKTGGVSTFCLSRIHPEAKKYALRLMKELKWDGIAMVEFKISNDSVPYFMEINPRIWGTIPLYIKSGIDIPIIAYKKFVYGDLDYSYANSFKENIKMRFLVEDLRAINSQYRGFSKILEIIKVFTSSIYVKDAVFDIRDPMPFIIPLLKTSLKKLKFQKKYMEL